MNDMKLAKWLNGTDRESDDPGRVRYYYGTAVEDSADGKVKIKTDGMMITQDNQDYVELGCYGNIKEGTVVRIASVNGSPAVDGDIGWGDRINQNVVHLDETVGELETTVDGMESLVDDASKVATNFLDFDEEGGTGLTIGNMIDETLGKNVQIDAEGVNIRDGNTVLAKLQAALVELGRTLKTAVIKLCGGVLQITANDKAYGGQTGSTGSITCTGGDDKADISMSSVNGYSQNMLRAHNSTNMIQAYNDNRTSYGSAASDMHTQWNDNGINIETTGSYVRSHADVNLLSNTNASNNGLTASYQLGRNGTVFNAVLNLSADSTNGGQIQATFYDKDNSTERTVRLKPIYRLRNPNGFYLFTASSSERTQLLGYGWEDEGIGFYAFA